MRGARMYLVVLGVVTAALGVAYVAAPTVFTDPTGFPALPAKALTDVRATYGGLQIAAGVFLLWTAIDRGRYLSGLFLLSVLFTAVGGSRAIGLLADGDPTSAMVGAMVFEVSMAAVSWFVYLRVRSTISGVAG